MYDRPRLVCVSMFCSLLLAACGGGGDGGGGGGSVTTTDPTPSMLVATYGGYGAWNVAIQAAIPALSDCASNKSCNDPFPAAPGPIVSPFGATAAFNPATDHWEAIWTGDIAGYRHDDPDTDGPLTRHWTGTAFLEIKASDRSTVQFWTDRTAFLLEDGSRSLFGPSGIPDTLTPVDDRWTATLSTEAGRKGYFSGSGSGTGLWGQFSAAASGTTPSTAIGHIDRNALKATFTVSKQETP